MIFLALTLATALADDAKFRDAVDAYGRLDLDEAVASLSSLDTAPLTNHERALVDAWLGVAYGQQNDLDHARHAFEAAVAADGTVALPVRAPSRVRALLEQARRDAAPTARLAASTSTTPRSAASTSTLGAAPVAPTTTRDAPASALEHRVDVAALSPPSPNAADDSAARVRGTVGFASGAAGVIAGAVGVAFGGLAVRDYVLAANPAVDQVRAGSAVDSAGKNAVVGGVAAGVGLALGVAAIALSAQ